MSNELMDKQGVLALARKLVEENPNTLRNPDRYLIHLEDTYGIADETARVILSQYPRFRSRLITKEVALAGGLHDIGRPLAKDQLFHELRGAEYIKQYGLEAEVTDNLPDLYRIAKMFRSHGFVFEQFQDPNNAEARAEFDELDVCPDLLLPKTINEKIVVYSDLSNVNGERVSVPERMEDLSKNYKDDPKLNKAIEQSLPRILKTAEIVEALKTGKLPNAEILAYGFL